MDGCIFCKIVKGEIPCAKVYEDKDVLAFLDISPVHKGHALVIPKKHYSDIFDIPEDELKKVISAVKKVSKAVMQAVNADGISINQSNKSAAGQVVMHYHVHIIPRFSNDGLRLWPKGADYSEKEMQQVAEKIKSKMWV
jgi:histidine triad (HIT) family protein